MPQEVSPEQDCGDQQPSLTFTGEIKTFCGSKIESGKLRIDANHTLGGKST
jgi:hypothetical protein